MAMRKIQKKKYHALLAAIGASLAMLTAPASAAPVDGNDGGSGVSPQITAGPEILSRDKFGNFYDSKGNVFIPEGEQGILWNFYDGTISDSEGNVYGRTVDYAPVSGASFKAFTVPTSSSGGTDTTASVHAGDTNIKVTSQPVADAEIPEIAYTVSFNDDITINNSITAKQFKVGGNVYISENGLNANSQKITNVAAGTADTDAVNVKQLRDAMAASGGGSSSGGGNPLAVEYDSIIKDTVTLQGAYGTTITNLSDGEVAATSSDAVNGSQLYHEQQERIAADNELSNRIGSLDANETYNIIKAGDSVSQNLKALDAAVAAGEGNPLAVEYDSTVKDTVTLKGENGTTITNLKDGEVSATSTDAVNGSQLYDEQQARIKGDKEEAEARIAADNELSERIGFLDENETYNVINAGDSVSQNLKALDAATGIVKDDGNEITIGKNSETKVINVAGKGGEPRIITGVKTDPNDGSSAANVDYVNRQANRAISYAEDYADDIAAQSAAMSSLHPLDWEKDDKVSVAASIGAYKSSVAGAVGAFYRADSKSMVGFQAAFGKNDNMYGIGFSKKFGKEKPAEDSALSAEEASAIYDELESLRIENRALESKYQTVEAQNQQILKLLEEKGILAE